jgi:hypothetical protein
MSWPPSLGGIGRVPCAPYQYSDGLASRKRQNCHTGDVGPLRREPAVVILNDRLSPRGYDPARSGNSRSFWRASTQTISTSASTSRAPRHSIRCANVAR